MMSQDPRMLVVEMAVGVHMCCPDFPFEEENLTEI